MKNKVGSSQLEFHKGILWIVDCGRVDNGWQSCCADAAFHHYVEVTSIVQHLYSSDIPSGSACAIVASLGLKSSSKK